MDEAVILTLASVLAVSLLSLLGVAYLGIGLLRRHTVLMTLVAVAVGALLGDAFLHVLPKAAALWGGFDARLGLLVLFGFLPFFILESILHWRHHHGDDDASHEPSHGHQHGHGNHGHGHGHAHHEDEGQARGSHPDGAPKTGRTAAFGWVNLAGSALHNFIDGAIIAAAFLADRSVGFATALAVGLHEIPHEFGDVAVLLRSGMRPRRAILFNFLSALVALLGACIVLFLPIPHDAIERYALPITAGGFLYIAAADLVPELHHHTGHRREVSTILAGLLAGLGVMALLLQLEA